MIKNIPGVLESRRAEREITVLEADEVNELPKLTFTIKLISDKKFSAFTKPYTKRGGQVDMSNSETQEFRKSILGDCVVKWQGMCTGNARKLCQVLLEHPELIEEGDPVREWPFDPSDLDFIAKEMNGPIFGRILDEALSLSAFAEKELSNLKKG